MTNFVYSPDNSQVLLPKMVNIHQTAVFLEQEVSALLDWVQGCPSSSAKEKQECTKIIKEHFSNARATTSVQDIFFTQNKMIKQILTYAQLPQSKTKEGVELLKKFSDGTRYVSVKGKDYTMKQITYFGFPLSTTFKTFHHMRVDKIDDNTKTTQDVMSLSKKQKNFILSAKKVEDMLDKFILSNKNNLNNAKIQYTINFQDNKGTHQDKICEIELSVKPIISSLKAFNKSIIKLLQTNCKDFIEVDLDAYRIKKWAGSLEDSSTFIAKEAFYLLVSDGKDDGFVGLKETNHSSGGLWRHCIVKDINGAHIFHAMPSSIDFEFQNVHKINVAIDFKDVGKTPKAKNLDIANRIQAYIEKNKLESIVGNIKAPNKEQENPVETKKSHKI